MKARNDAIRTSVHYRNGRIVLTGERPDLQLEAERILLRFRFSACPYTPRHVDDRHIVLVPCR
ncbi:hypothetical protein [Arhodomonas sp. AD133]|uniref:hypothetical protein n=1 Tax=Arhodomonas sp. AD133 TaxID=3415009 RepID=UPI003EBF4A81